MVDAGADLNVRGRSGRTALMLAEQQCASPEITKLLFTANADLDLQDTEGWTAVIYAVDGGRAETLRLLVDAGADVNLKTIVGKKARSFVQRRAKESRRTLIEILTGVVPHEDPYALIKAVISGCELPHINELLQPGNLDVDERQCTPGTRAETALVYAARAGSINIVRRLLQAGADTSITDDKGRSPLHWAILKRHAETAWDDPGAPGEYGVRAGLTLEMAERWAGSEDAADAAAGSQVLTLLTARRNGAEI